MEIMSFMLKGWELLTPLLTEYLNWESVIILYGTIYFLISRYVNKRVGIEFAKRREIIQDIHLYKMTHPDEIYPELEQKDMKTVFHQNKRTYPESYFKSLEQIVINWRARPLRAMLLFFFQYFIFVTMLGYFLAIDGYIQGHYSFYYIAVSLFILLLIGKRLIVLKMIFAVMIIVSYQYFSMEALLLLIITTGLRLLMKIIAYIKTAKR